MSHPELNVQNKYVHYTLKEEITKFPLATENIVIQSKFESCQTIEPKDNVRDTATSHKLIHQIMPCINIPSPLVVQKTLDLEIKPQSVQNSTGYKDNVCYKEFTYDNVNEPIDRPNKNKEALENVNKDVTSTINNPLVRSETETKVIRAVNPSLNEFDTKSIHFEPEPTDQIKIINNQPEKRTYSDESEERLIKAASFSENSQTDTLNVVKDGGILKYDFIDPPREPSIFSSLQDSGSVLEIIKDGKPGAVPSVKDFSRRFNTRAAFNNKLRNLRSVSTNLLQKSSKEDLAKVIAAEDNLSEEQLSNMDNKDGKKKISDDTDPSRLNFFVSKHNIVAFNESYSDKRENPQSVSDTIVSNFNETDESDTSFIENYAKKHIRSDKTKPVFVSLLYFHFYFFLLNYVFFFKLRVIKNFIFFRSH